MRLLRNFAVSAVFGLLALSCVKNTPSVPSVSFPVEEINFMAEGGKQTITILLVNASSVSVSIGADEQFSDKSDWLSASGKNSKLELSATPNTTGAERVAWLKAEVSTAGGNAEAVIPVRQAAGSATGGEITLKLGAGKLEFTAEGGSKDVSITTNATYWFVDWEGEDFFDLAEWVDFEDIGDDAVRIVVEPNDGEARVAYFYVMASWEDLNENEDAEYVEEVIEIRQAAGEAPVDDDDESWKKVTSSSDLTSGWYLIAYESGSVIFDGSRKADQIDKANNTKSVKVKNGKIEAAEGLENSAFWYDESNGSLKAAAGYYIDWTGSKNGLSTSESPAPLSVSISGGNADIVSSNSYSLRFNSKSDQMRFRFYKSGQEAVQMYRQPASAAKPAFGVSTTVLQPGPKATSASFSVVASPSVEWTAALSNTTDFTLSKTSGTGPADVTVSFSANTTTEPRSTVITVSTTNEAVETASFEINLTQGPASEGDIDDGTPGYNDHLIKRRIHKRL